MIPLTVIVSKAYMDNGDEWKHITLTRIDRLPSWVEIMRVKRDFIGPQKEAFHIFPKESEYNVQFFALHIWSPIKTLSQFPTLKQIKHEVSL